MHYTCLDPESMMYSLATVPQLALEFMYYVVSRNHAWMYVQSGFIAMCMCKQFLCVGLGILETQQQVQEHKWNTTAIP